MMHRKIYDIPPRNAEDDPHREERETIRRKMVEEAAQRNREYDPAHEAEINRRLEALGEPYITEFHRQREKSRNNRLADEALSQQEIDILNLEAMERSAAYRR